MSTYYLERLRKLKVQKDLIERSLIKYGSYPDKQYVQKLVDDIGTRLAIFDYTEVSASTTVDIEKLNNDMYAIYQDLKILYDIVAVLTEEKYTQLESYVDGYLKTLEELADRADTHAAQDIESTSLNADNVYFTNTLPSAKYSNNDVIITIGSIQCTPQSRIIGYVTGDGFDMDKAVFTIGADKIIPYPVDNSYVKAGGDITKTTYTYSITDDSLIAGASKFKIPISAISAQEHYYYEIYGGRNMVAKTSSEETTNKKVVDYSQELNTVLEETTTYSFYLTDATNISFEFSNAPTSANFSDYQYTSLKREDMKTFKFTLAAGESFSMKTDGITFATKETSAINNNSLYIANVTAARDFTIYEYQPGKKVTYDDVTLRIYDVDQTTFHIDMIAIKEISDLNFKQYT